MPHGNPPKQEFFKNFERVINFSDGVFSIAITLMVLSLAVPTITRTDAPTELLQYLTGLGLTFFIYIISFLIIGNWWVTHHRIFQHIRTADRTLLWLNLLFLFFITIVPFQAALLLRYPNTWVAVAFYAVTQAGAGLIIFALWRHASGGGRLTDPDISPVTVRYYSLRVLLGIVTYLISIGIAVFNPYLAQLSWIVVGVLIWWLLRRIYEHRLPALDLVE